MDNIHAPVVPPCWISGPPPPVPERRATDPAPWTPPVPLHVCASLQRDGAPPQETTRQRSRCEGLAKALAYMTGIPEDLLANPPVPTYLHIPTKALRAVARCFHFVLNNLPLRAPQASDSFDYSDWFEALMHARRGAAPGPDQARVDLFQQLSDLDDSLARKMFARDLAIAHGPHDARVPDPPQMTASLERTTPSP